MGQFAEERADVIARLVGGAMVQAMQIARANPDAPLDPMRVAFEQQVRPAIVAMISDLEAHLEKGADAVLETAAVFVESQHVSSAAHAAELVRKVKSTFPMAAE